MLSEAVLVLVIVIEVLEKTTNLGIDYEHDYEHEHDRINWRAKPIPAKAGMHLFREVSVADGPPLPAFAGMGFAQ